MPLILSTHELHPRAAELIAPEATLEVASSLEAQSLIACARDADVIIVRAPFPPEFFAQAPRLRAAIRHGAGIDMIPIDAATRAGVLVANVPGANARSVAEYVIFSALALARRFRIIDSELRSRGWNQARTHAIATSEISGRTIGLIGMGHVGREIHALARVFGMSVMVSKPSNTGVPADVTRKPLESVIAEADFLVLCCPLTEMTRGLMNRARLALMKPTAYLINVARGPVLIETDLLRALEEGVIAGAALDVFEHQPLGVDSPLFNKLNLILTPHLAGITDQSMERMGVGAAQEALRVLKGQLPLNLINPDALSTYHARFHGDRRPTLSLSVRTSNAVQANRGVASTPNHDGHDTL